MGEPENRAAIQRYFRATADKDWAAVSAMRHPEFTQEWPQMGERTVGPDNARAISEHHPGPPKGTIRRLHGAGDLVIVEADLLYGDGSQWTSAHIFEFKDGKVWRQTDYFGQPLPAPAWRAHWVERM